MRITIETESERPKPPRPCRFCKGTGKVPANDLFGSLAEIGGQPRKRCTECGGTGEER